jgi:hypothetical protein
MMVLCAMQGVSAANDCHFVACHYSRFTPASISIGTKQSLWNEKRSAMTFYGLPLRTLDVFLNIDWFVLV